MEKNHWMRIAFIIMLVAALGLPLKADQAAPNQYGAFYAGSYALLNDECGFSSYALDDITFRSIARGLKNPAFTRR